MVQLIAGSKGHGKTKRLLDKANSEIRGILGNICYLDKSTKHMFELNNRIRLINVKDFRIENADQFIGFVAGIISQDHDLEQMYFDSFLDIAVLKDSDISPVIERLQRFSTVYNVDFIVSISLDEADIPEKYRELIV
jgi:hypothetical protein